MRPILTQQLPLSQPFIAHPHGRELSVMSGLLDALPDELLEAVREDVLQERNATTGRRAMSAEQVVRVVVIKQLNGFSYRELAFHLADSTCYRAFCRFGALDRVASRSTLQATIKSIAPSTLEKVNEAIVALAGSKGIETRAKVRVDCTHVETDIHAPTDSGLLWDVVRVLTRTMRRVRDRVDTPFTDHSRRANRRRHGIRNAKSSTQRTRLYRDLLKVTEKTMSAARRVAIALQKRDAACGDGEAAAELLRVIALGEAVVSQTRRRVLEGEKVPASEKILSIFEPHTDLLVKGRKEPDYGHKICLSTGASGLVLDCMVLDGNPGDVMLTTEMVARHKARYATAPPQMAFDGAFASKDNLRVLKAEGVVDVMFSKRCGLSLTKMARSSWIYRRLRDFRAGIEGCISFLKRCFGLTRCTWRGLPSFKTYVWGSIVSANLLLLARYEIAAQSR